MSIIKNTSRCDMDTVDVDVNDLIFSRSILGKITGFFWGPKTGFFSPQKGPVFDASFPLGKMVTILVVLVLGILGRIELKTCLHAKRQQKQPKKGDLMAKRNPANDSQFSNISFKWYS